MCFTETFGLLCSSLVTGSIPHEVPQILINREQLPHLNFDVELLGDCDVIVNELCHRLGGDFAKLCHTPTRLTEITEKPPRPVPTQPEPAAAPGEDTDTGSSVQPAAEPPHTDADVTDTQTDTIETADKDREHCPNAQSPSVEGTKTTETKDSEDPQKDEALAAKDTAPRRCWLNRICRSPISKRLDSKITC